MVSLGRLSALSSSASFSLISWIGSLFVEIWLWSTWREFLCNIAFHALPTFPQQLLLEDQSLGTPPRWKVFIKHFHSGWKWPAIVSSFDYLAIKEVVNQHLWELKCWPTSQFKHLSSLYENVSKAMSLLDIVPAWLEKSHFNHRLGWGTWLGPHLVGKLTLALLSLGFRRRAGSEACSWIDICLCYSNLQNKQN